MWGVVVVDDDLAELELTRLVIAELDVDVIQLVRLIGKCIVGSAHLHQRRLRGLPHAGRRAREREHRAGSG